MADLFENMPPPGFTLWHAEKEAEALQDQISRFDHDIKHGCPSIKYGAQAQRYDANKRLTELQHWIKEIL